jgi:hypothetical protein
VESSTWIGSSRCMIPSPWPRSELHTSLRLPIREKASGVSLGLDLTCAESFYATGERHGGRAADAVGREERGAAGHRAANQETNLARGGVAAARLRVYHHARGAALRAAHHGWNVPGEHH